MPEPIGSVYLDRQRPSRARRPPKRGVRAVIAAQLALIGILGLTVAGLLSAVRAAISTPDPAVAAIQSTLDDEESHAEIKAEVASMLQAGFLSPMAIDAAESYGVDYQAEIDAWATAVLEDPEFDDAVGELITEVHGRIFVEAEPGPVDAGPLTDIAIASAHATAPTLAPFLPPDGQVITIDASDLPDLSQPLAAGDRAILIALVSGAALPIALFVHDRRHWVLAWIGRWLFVVGLVLGLAAIGLPYVAGRMTGWVTVETAVRSVSIRLLAPAGIIGTIGMGLASIAALWRRREQRTAVQEGAAAWLEVVEPPPAMAPSPSFDLARRGLVDGSRQLTNL